MGDYWKRLKVHPGVPVAALITVFMVLAGTDGRGRETPEDMLIGAGIGALVSLIFWVVVLWTARTQPLPKEPHHEND